jgi:hypothetical protein
VGVEDTAAHYVWYTPDRLGRVHELLWDDYNGWMGFT